MTELGSYKEFTRDEVLSSRGRGLDLTRVPGAGGKKTNFIVASTKIFEPGDIVTVVDSFFWHGRNGIVVAYEPTINEVAVHMERMDNETELIFIHPGRIKKIG